MDHDHFSVPPSTLISPFEPRPGDSDPDMDEALRRALGGAR